MNYDFSDPEIRNMVSRDHVPTENWALVQQGYTPGSNVRCDVDRHAWPCPVIQALRASEEAGRV